MSGRAITIAIGCVMILVLLVLLYLGLVTVASEGDRREEEFIREYYRKYGRYPWDVPTADDEIDAEGDA